MVRLIIGCGYLGLRVARLWLERGDTVIALSRSPSKLAKRALPEAATLQILGGDITDVASLPEFPVADTLLFAVGLDRTQSSDSRAIHVQGLQTVLQRLPLATKRLVYISSTGVYGNSRETTCPVGSEVLASANVIDESSLAVPERDTAKACLEAETLLGLSPWRDRTTILRFAGIYGPDRIPLSQAVANRQWQQLSPDGFLNLIHVDDGAQVIAQLADLRTNGQMFLVSDGNPVPRRDFYEAVAARLGTGPIEWASAAGAASSSLNRGKGAGNRRIDNRKLTGVLNYQFRYPDYRIGLDDVLGPAVAD